MGLNFYIFFKIFLQIGILFGILTTLEEKRNYKKPCTARLFRFSYLRLGFPEALFSSFGGSRLWLHCWEQFKLYSITQHWSALLSTSSASILYILYSSAQVLIAFLKLAYNLAYWLIYV